MSTFTNIASSKLTPDDTDDLIYACRTGNLDWLSELITTWSTQLSIPAFEVIKSAIDIDDEGLGSRACLLHYPAANGNLEITTYLLEKISASSVSANDTQVDGASNPTKIEEERKRFVNTQNVNGNTPLHWAALNGHIEVVMALVKTGADPTIVNEAGRDAVVEAEYSSKESAAECANWLLKECDTLETGAGGQMHEGQAGVGDEEGEGVEVEEGKEKEKAMNGVH